jgi:hypothetical protein
MQDQALTRIVPDQLAGGEMVLEINDHSLRLLGALIA